MCELQVGMMAAGAAYVRKRGWMREELVHV